MAIRVLVANAVVLGTMAWLLGVGAETRAKPLVGRSDDAALGGLEAQAALHPGAAEVQELAGAYLQRRQPGLALALIDRASPEIRRDPDLVHLEARALFQRGQPRQALALAREVQARCEADVACAPWRLAKSTRHLAFVEAVVSAGIEDPDRDPDATRTAYERSAREVRLVAMR